MRAMMRWNRWQLGLAFSLTAILSIGQQVQAETLPVVRDVEFQPLAAQARRVLEALSMLGEPITGTERTKIDHALDSTGGEASIRTIQEVLDAHCLVGIQINPESRVKSIQGPAAPKLVQGGWSNFLIKVHNEAGVTAELALESPNAAKVYRQSTSSAEPKVSVKPFQIIERWMDVSLYTDRPLKRGLSGLGLEYAIIQIYSRDAGKREGKITFNVGQGTQDLGFRSDVDILFTCEPGVVVLLDVRDEDGRPQMASFTFRDALGRVYPSPGRRLAPDFFFHPQVYRQTGESVILPPGDYRVEYGRGPEYLVQSRTIRVPKARSHAEGFRLTRWIDLAKLN